MDACYIVVDALLLNAAVSVARQGRHEPGLPSVDQTFGAVGSVSPQKCRCRGQTNAGTSILPFPITRCASSTLSSSAQKSTRNSSCAANQIYEGDAFNMARVCSRGQASRTTVESDRVLHAFCRPPQHGNVLEGHLESLSVA
jgi:hypothetical protein